MSGAVGYHFGPVDASRGRRWGQYAKPAPMDLHPAPGTAPYIDAMTRGAYPAMPKDTTEQGTAPPSGSVKV